MASKNKTPHYALNQWEGTDCPKRTDFNSDNAILDAALFAHASESALHLAAGERDSWNEKSTVISGRYVGNGASLREISLSAPAAAVHVTEAGVPPLAGTICRFATAGVDAAGFGAALTAGGFSVQAATADGCSVHLNEMGKNYLYFALNA